MNRTWTIRPATPADVPAVVTLCDALFQEDSGQRDPLMNHAWARQHGHAYFAGRLDDPRYVVLVAEHGGSVIGYLAGSTTAPGALRPVQSAELESMWVEPDWRGHGVGHALAEALLRWAHGQGAVWITVSAYAANIRAVAFYERLGFSAHTVTLGRRLER